MIKKILLLADINSSHTRKWAEGVKSSGYEVAIYSLSIPENVWFTKADIKLLSSAGFANKDFIKNDFKKLSYLKHYSAIKKSIEEFKPDIIHAHYATSYGCLGALASKHPFVISVWGSDIFDFPKRTFLHSLFLKWILKKSDLVLSTSRIMAREVAKYYSGECIVTSFGIDTNRFFPKPVRDEKYFTIGIIKKLEPVYGIDNLIHAFKIILEKFPGKNLRLVIVGDGYKKADYKRLCDSLNISGKVMFVDKIPQEEVPAMHNSFNVFVNPSLHESFGVSVLEASACGVPVIATNVGGLPEVVEEGVTGKLVANSNVMDLAEAIAYFIENPEMAGKYGMAGREFVSRKYNWKNNLNLINDIYRRL